MNILLAMIPAFFWGTTYAMTQLTLPDWPPLLLGALRALPAGLILLAIKPSLPQKTDWSILIKLGAINIAVFFSLIFIMALTLPSAMTKALGSRIHWWTILTWQLIIGGTLLLVVAGIQALFSPQQYIDVVSQFSLTNGFGISWIILLNTVLGYSMYVWLLQRMSVVDFTFGGIANPIAGIVCGLVLMGESYTPHQYLLMSGMILASIAPTLIQLIRQKKLRAIASD